MQLHELQPTRKRPTKKRIGRGGKKGTYSGRGMKGQKSRAGNRPAPVVRELIKRYPKVRGYRGVQRRRKPQTATLSLIQKAFAQGGLVSPATLLEKDIIQPYKGKALVKIVGNTPLHAVFKVKDCLITPKAKASIEKAGGKVT